MGPSMLIRSLRGAGIQTAPSPGATLGFCISHRPQKLSPSLSKPHHLSSVVAWGCHRNRRQSQQSLWVEVRRLKAFHLPLHILRVTFRKSLTSLA